MKVLVTGNLGYIGSVLTPLLLDHDYQVSGLDAHYYEGITALPQSFNYVDQIIKDIRKVTINDLKGVNSIIHLAALSNDPLGELNPQLTYEINYLATVRLAKLAKSAGIERFVYASSQSMYGISNTDQELDEELSEKNPVTEYAKTKWQAECELKQLNSNEFTTVSFRPSTVFGQSPKLRCDIVFNSMVGCAYTTGKIEIRNDGTPWRPVVHVRDVSAAFIAGIEAPKEIVSGQSYNVGIENGNYTIRELAEAANNAYPESSIIYTGEEGSDARTYRVSFDKILTELKSYYKPEWDLTKGGEELVSFFKEIDFSESDYRGLTCNRLAALKDLKEKGLIDPELYPINNPLGKERA